MAITVDTLVDDNDGDVSAGRFSLREAIASSVTGDNINFASSLTGGTITLTQGQLVINKALTIKGLGADKLTISGDNASRVFKVDDALNTASRVFIDGLTIANGFVGDSIGDRFGAGILNNEALQITNSVIKGNRAAIAGGGISNRGNLSITSSTINNNFAGLGGGGISSGDIEGAGNLLAIGNTTISGNETNGEGGGISNADTSRLIVNSSTIYQNRAARGGGVFSSLIAAETINSTIIAGNLDNDSSDGNNPDVSGTFTTTLFNLIGDGSGSTSFTNGVNGNKVGTSTTPLDPKLSSLQKNGGSTPTHALLNDSPAIDAANPSANVTVDQRGVARPQRNGFDIGAFEASLQVPIPVITDPSPVVIDPTPIVVKPLPRKVLGTARSDVLLGSADNDVFVGGVGGDVMTGGNGADQFVYTGVTRRRALVDSQISNSPRLTRRRLDQITDFDSLEGDRIKLDFDNNLNTAELPTRIHNVGRVRSQALGGGKVQRGRAPVQAIEAAYNDTDPITPGRQRVRVSEAVIVTYKGRTFLSVNDNHAGFDPKRDMVADVTGINFQRSQDALAGATLLVSNYFV